MLHMLEMQAICLKAALRRVICFLQGCLLRRLSASRLVHFFITIVLQYVVALTRVGAYKHYQAPMLDIEQRQGNRGLYYVLSMTLFSFYTADTLRFLRGYG